MKKVWATTLLILIIAFGLFFRLYQINDKSLWLDEGVTYYNSSGDSLEEVWDKTAELDQSPPAYYFVMHGFLEIFGENEFGFRVVPVIFGILSILMLYLLGSVMFNREVGLFSAFLLAINPFHIGYSVESRMYVMLSLVALIGMYFLYKAMTSEGRSYLNWLFFSLFSVIGIYTHSFFFFVLAGYALVFLLLLIPAKKRLGKFLAGLLSAVIVVVSFIPWLPNLLHQLDVERYWLVENSFWDLKGYLWHFSNEDKRVLYSLFGLGILGVIWHLFAEKAKRYKKEIYSTVAILLFAGIGFGLPLAFSLMWEPVMKLRYMIYILPFFLMTAGMGIYVFRRYFWAFSVPILVFFVAVLMPWKTSIFPEEMYEDFRGLNEIIQEDPDTLVVHSPSISHVINFYSKGSLEIRPFPVSFDLRDYNIGKASEDRYKAYINDLDSFYLVVSHSHEIKEGLLFRWSDEVCKKKKSIEVEGMELTYFEECK